jgi:hypothetical protein
MYRYERPTDIQSRKLKPRRLCRRRERLGWRLIGRPQEKAAWPSGPCVSATPSPEVAGSAVRQSGGLDFGFAKALRPRALRGVLVSKWLARVAQGFGALMLGASRRCTTQKPNLVFRHPRQRALLSNCIFRLL